MLILLPCLIWGKYPVLEKLKWRWGPRSENALGLFALLPRRVKD